MHLEKVVGLGQVHGLTPPEVLLVDEGSNATEFHEIMLLQLGSKRQLIEVVVGGHAFTQALPHSVQSISFGALIWRL